MDLFLFVCFCFRTSYKGNHTVYMILYLGFTVQHNFLRFIHDLYVAGSNFLLISVTKYYRNIGNYFSWTLFSPMALNWLWGALNSSPYFYHAFILQITGCLFSKIDLILPFQLKRLLGDLWICFIHKFYIF